MSTESEKYWKIVTNQLRSEGKLTPLSLEEAEKEYELAPEEPLSIEEREEILRRVTCTNNEKVKSSLPTPPVRYVPPTPTDMNCNNEFAQLNRNKGSDSEAEEILRKLREEALSEDESESDEN